MDMIEATSRTLFALTVWREARGEPYLAKVAVAYSILERVSHPGWWGRDIVAVTTKAWQYSSMTDPHDPQLTRWPTLSDPSYIECWDACAAALDKTAANPAPTANSYWDSSISPPIWATPQNKVAQIGTLSFHRVPSPPERKDA